MQCGSGRRPRTRTSAKGWCLHWLWCGRHAWAGRLAHAPWSTAWHWCLLLPGRCWWPVCGLSLPQGCCIQALPVPLVRALLLGRWALLLGSCSRLRLAHTRCCCVLQRCRRSQLQACQVCLLIHLLLLGGVSPRVQLLLQRPVVPLQALDLPLERLALQRGLALLRVAPLLQPPDLGPQRCEDVGEVVGPVVQQRLVPLFDLAARHDHDVGAAEALA
mmetsp:Transcript_37174/g.93721  ORF Transcript_37174/g.93721 Transcript_37174/m.93721 type:complete len:217 (-) Transcript_37174:773-1423(-)